MKRTLTVLAFSLISASFASSAVITNGSFETGNLSGWSSTSTTNGELFYLGVYDASYYAPVGLPKAEPTSGSYLVAIPLFSSGQPQSIRQDVGVLDGSSAVLTFDYRVGWDYVNFEESGGTTINITVQPAGGGTALATYNIFNAPSYTENYDTGWMTARVDLSSFIGTNAEISLEVLGPGGVGTLHVDNFALNAAPEPSALTVFGATIAGALLRRPRRHNKCL